MNLGKFCSTSKLFVVTVDVCFLLIFWFFDAKHQTKHRLSQEIHFTVTHEYERVTKIVQLQRTIRLPHEWPLPQKIHCVSSDRNNRGEQIWRDYAGLTENTFKTHFANHKTSFNNPSKRMITELSKHVWNLKDSNINFRITWKILKLAIVHNPS